MNEWQLPEDSVGQFLGRVRHEYQRARAVLGHPPLNSYHEGYAVLKEEVEEAWDEIRKNGRFRDRSAIRGECVQIAAMAMAMAIEL